MSNPRPRQVHLAELVRYVAERHSVTAKDILGPRRWPRLVDARREIAAALFDADWPYSEIGRALGGRHHTSAMYYLGAIKGRTHRHESP